MKMKATKSNSVRMLCKEITLLTFAIVSISALGATDITAYMRSLGSGYSVSGGALLSATPAANAVDGVGFERIDGGAVRFPRLTSNGSGGYKINPAELNYKFLDGRTAILTAFTVYRYRRATYSDVGDKADLARTPKRFKLLARNGDSDAWTTLYETAEDAVWGKDIASNRFEIAEANRRPYAQYRFALDLTNATNEYYVANTQGNDDYYSYHELVLEGAMTLSWTGDANNTWSGSDANWSNGAESLAWQPSAMAVFGGGNDVAVSGTQNVSGIKVGSAGACSISGGALAIGDPAYFDIASSTTISSTITDANDADSAMRFDIPAVTNVLDCRNGSFLPRSETNSKTGAAVLCWPGRSLRDLVSVVSCGFKYGGASASSPSIEFFANDFTTASFQVQYYTSTPYGMAVKVELTQVGSDIYARAVYAKRKDIAKPQDPLNFDSATGTSAKNILDDDHNTDTYGVRNIKLAFREDLNLNGAFTSERDLVVNGNTLSFGAPSLAFAQDVSGTGTLKFAPASGSQNVAFGGSCGCDGGMILSGATTVTVSDAAPFASGMPLAMEDGATLSVGTVAACTVGVATFSGTTTIAVAKGATISFDSVSFADGAIVNLVLSGSAAGHGVRIGTTASLSAEELAHFVCNGKPVKVQLEDGWLNVVGNGLVLFVR